jgi:hypothetical protein
MKCFRWSVDLRVAVPIWHILHPRQAKPLGQSIGIGSRKERAIHEKYRKVRAQFCEVFFSPPTLEVGAQFLEAERFQVHSLEVSSTPTYYTTFSSSVSFGRQRMAAMTPR